MNKTIMYIFGIFIFAILVTGCGKSSDKRDFGPVDDFEEPKFVQEETVRPQPVVETPKDPKEYTPEPVASTPSKVPSKAIQDLLKKHTRVKSVTYMYQDSINYPAKWEIRVMGNLLRVELREEEKLSGDVYVDTVYLDSSRKTAVGYCESKIYRCADPNQEHQVRYEKYIRKTPLDWIKEVTYAERLATEQRQQRTVVKIAYDDEDGNQVTMWVDDYFGVPLEVQIKKGSDTKKYSFDNIAFNNVDESSLKHQFIGSTYR